MAATIKIKRWTGSVGSPTKTDVAGSTTRISTSDSPSPGTNNPIPIPDAGTKRSYWLTLGLNALTSPSSVINNLKFYSDGSNGYGTGVTMVAQRASAYVQATGTLGDTGNELTQANHASLAAAPVDVFTLTAASPLSLDGSISNPNTGDFGDLVVLQMSVAATAKSGIVPVEQFIFRYDEI